MPLTPIVGPFNIGGYCGPFDAAIATALIGSVLLLKK